jgi:hypothetical protein
METRVSSQAHSRIVFYFLFGYIFFRRRNVLNTILYIDKNYTFSIAQFLKMILFFFRKSENVDLSFI